MSTSLTSWLANPGPPRKGWSQGHARIAVLGGGAFGVGATYPSIVGADLVIVVDAAGEIDRRYPQNRVMPVPLGAGETIDTLTEDCACDPDVALKIQSLGGAPSADGMSQMPLLGELAIRKYVNDPAFQKELQNVFDRLLSRHNGVLKSVTIDGFGGQGGGTAPAAVQIYSGKLAAFILDRSRAQVSTFFHRVGLTSYIGLGPRIPENVASTVTHDTTWATSPDRHPLEARYLNLVELPICGDDQDRRDNFAAELAQAMSASEVRELLASRGSNATTNPELGYLGNFSMIRPDWWHRVDDGLIASDVAREFDPQIAALLASPASASDLEDIELRYKVTEDGIPVDEMMYSVSKAGGVRPENLQENCEQPERRFVGADVWGTFARENDRLEGPDSACRHLWEPAQSDNAIHRKLSDLRAIDKRMADMLDRRARMLGRAERADRIARKKLASALGLLFPRHIFDHLRAAFTNRRNALIKVKNAMIRARETRTKLDQLRAEIAALENVLRSVRQETRTEERRIEAVAGLVLMFRTRRGEDNAPLVSVGSLNRILPRLLDIVADAYEFEPQRSVVRRLLASAVDEITLVGLAHIVNAPTADAYTIARRLVTRTAPHEGPPWGGQLMANACSHDLIVLPPVNSDVQLELERAVKAKDPGLQVLVADSAEAGLNIVRLRVHKTGRTQDIMTTLLDRNLQDAEKDPGINRLRADSRSRLEALNNGLLVPRGGERGEHPPTF